MDEAKQFVLLSRIEMMYSHVWNLKPSKVNWKKEGVDLLSMSYLRCNTLGDWKLFDEAMSLAPSEIINQFKIEFKRNEGIDFDRNIADIKKESKKSAKNFESLESDKGNYDQDSEENDCKYVSQKKNFEAENQINLKIALKNIYRKLVRKLHPDHCNITEANYNWSEIWTQVQSAYKNNDVKKLTEIFYLTEYWADKFSLSLWEYETLNKYLEDEIVRLKNESSHMNNHPAWGFSKKKTFVNLQNKIKKELNSTLDEISEKVDELNQQFWYLDMSSRKFKKSSIKKRSKGRKSNKKNHKKSDFDELFEL